ncbi:BspA family leucine-rich repeat surface protein [Chryseobacterium sp.]|uniref:BspA family leucine-rich repeat surface protein n=1 Tax=Chryseobacterium sp. TaxID=1871047 RepID=UPI00289C00FA|nr:BspA family leucine-rich repeat surface protein [Chryseobacterium sp.]
MKKIILLLILSFSVHLVKAQNEFITIWEPAFTTSPVINVNAPFQSNANQIWFPGIGENYTIEWEEVGYPQNNGIMTNVTSTSQVLIDFGPVREGNPTNTRYRVKVSNGNGVFRQIRFATHSPFNSNLETNVPILQLYGNSEKIREIEQWGNIAWTTMKCAFTNCQKLQITATDSPNLSMVTDASLMFYRAFEFSGASSMANWDTSHIQNFSFMFAAHYNGVNFATLPLYFNPPYFSNWDVSSATDLSYMFTARDLFNQNLNNWDVSNVTKMNWMFAYCASYNQPLNNWDTSSLADMHYMFTNNAAFNQPLDNWDVSHVKNMNNALGGCSSFNQPLDVWDVSNVTKMSNLFGGDTAFNQPLNSWDVGNVTNMGGMFSSAVNFNQPLSSWNVSKVTDMSNMFSGATSFNQSLETWNLNALVSAQKMVFNTGLSCINYSSTLSGWADNPNTANNVNLSFVAPAVYATNVVPKRNILISKGWNINDDAMGTCVLSTKELAQFSEIIIYPNPATDFIYVKNLKNTENYQIFDLSGRLILKGNFDDEKIDIRSLEKGNYILQIKTKDDVKNLKFIKK